MDNIDEISSHAIRMSPISGKRVIFYVSQKFEDDQNSRTFQQSELFNWPFHNSSLGLEEPFVVGPAQLSSLHRICTLI